ncbi:MAG TPA: hypothetical protein VFN42_13470, partial [Acetobacteraceae bacterium]|nr:hypothetical protein [Acetobacteraceae bacterium]
MSVTYVSGQTSSGLVIDRGSLLQVQAGGTIVDATFNGGVGFGEVSALAVGISVNSGGFFDLQSGSFGSGIVVNSGGQAGADFGGSATDIAVNNGGTLSIDTSGTASDVLVNSGGTFVVSAGGSASDVMLNGGTLDVLVGGSVSGAIDFVPGTGGTVVVSSPASAGNAIPELTYSGFGPHDSIDLMGAFYTGSNTFAVSGSTVTLVVPLQGLPAQPFPMIMENPQPGVE